MSRKSRIIIVGSGIVGASTAYHLAQLGWKDMVILDQGPLLKLEVQQAMHQEEFSKQTPHE